jgi:hypothetical protein
MARFLGIKVEISQVGEKEYALKPTIYRLKIHFQKESLQLLYNRYNY